MIRRILAAAAALALTAQAAPPPRFTPPPDPYAGHKRLLVIADLSTGNQSAHMAVSHAISVIEQMGRQSGAYIAFLRTDTDWITLSETWGKGAYAKGGPKQARGKNLNYFDAVLFYTNGDTNLTDQQKADLLGWIRAGHGFVGIHTATVTATNWPEYGEMLGGVFDNHPWFVADAKVIVERPESPIMRGWKTGMSLRDEHYQMLPAPYSRDKVDVLARLDPKSVDLKSPQVHRTDADFPVAWIKDYGAGRVFYSGLGHTDAAWDDPRVRSMTLAAVKWVLNGGEVVKPHPIGGR